jgi:hypothetical protein
MANLFGVDLDSEFDKMFRENVSLSSYITSNQEDSYNRLWRMIYGKYHEDFFFMRKWGPPKGGISIIKTLLKNERAYENPLFYLLFKGLAYGEYRFVRDFIPQRSHEERLTGHLISEVCNGLNIIQSSIRKRGLEIYGKEIELELYYADVAAERKERTTGADFALIFHVDLPDMPEATKAIICQAKKIENNADIPPGQLETLLKYAGDNGYYCFYDMDMNEKIAPVLMCCKRVKEILHEENKGRTVNRTDVYSDWRKGIPLSIFIIFKLLDVYSRTGSGYSSLWDAKRFVLGGDRGGDGPFVTKVLVASVGGVTRKQEELKGLGDLFR